MVCAGHAVVVGQSQTHRPPFLGHLRPETRRLQASCPTLPALGLGGRYKCGYKMKCLFSLKWNLSSFLSRGLLKISFLLLASLNCFIWHCDEKS